MRSLVPLRHVLLTGASLALLVALCASPGSLGDRVRSSFDGISAASPAWLWAAAACFAVTTVGSGLAWHAALGACGARLAPTDSAARYCIGSGLNAVAPAHLGSAVRLMLFGPKVEGGAWTVGGASAAVGATRAVWMIGLIATGSALGVIPAWPLLVLGGCVAAAAAAGIVARRRRLPRRVEDVLTAFRELGDSPRHLAIVMGWTLTGAVLKIAAAFAVAASLGVDHPLRAALVIVPAIELAAVMPVTPGNVGVGSAAIAFALAAQGVDARLGLSVGIAFGAVEWLVGVAAGVAGAVALAAPFVRPRLVVVGTAAACCGIASAFGATVLLPSFA